MDEFIPRGNIKRFRSQLSSSSDEEQKAVLRQLIEEEERKLQQALEAKRVSNSVAGSRES